MKKHFLALLLCAGLIPAALTAQEADPLYENIMFYHSFDGTLQPDQSRGSDKIQNGRLVKENFSFIPGVKGKAVYCANKNDSLYFTIKDNLDFSVPGSISTWVYPKNWIVQTKDTPNQGKTKWKQTYSCGLINTAYNPKGYVVLQRMTSHVPGGKDLLWLGFPCFQEIKKSNVSKQYDFQLGKWYHIVQTWDGLNFTVYVNGEEILKTAVPHKITGDYLARLFPINVSKGMAVDEFTIYDKQLSSEEVKTIFNKLNPKK
jgi:hypothetical protein